MLFSSGMSAITSVLLTLKSGDHVICSNQLYEGTFRVIENIFAKLGIEASFVSQNDVAKTIKENSKLIWFESVSNPLLEVTDIRKLAAVKGKCKLVIDSTFTPLLDVFVLGADIVIQSASKFLSGQHNIIAGMAATNDNTFADKILEVRHTTGTMLSPFECFLLSMGLKTLKIRLDCQKINATKLAEFLRDHPKVEKTIFPELNNIAQTPIVSFLVKGNVNAFCKNLKLVRITQSFGGFSTTIQVPKKMMSLSHGETISENLVRVSVGLEDISDIINDFDNALGNT